MLCVPPDHSGAAGSNHEQWTATHRPRPLISPSRLSCLYFSVLVFLLLPSPGLRVNSAFFISYFSLSTGLDVIQTIYIILVVIHI